MIDEALLSIIKSRVYGVTHDAHDCEDAVQDTIVTVLRKGHTARSLHRWVNRVARNAALQIVKRRARCRFIEIDDAQDTRDGRTAKDSFDELTAGCNDLDKEVLSLFYRDGLSLPEIVDKLDVPIGTVKRRLFNARQRMRERMP